MLADAAVDLEPAERALFRTPDERRARRRGLWGDAALRRSKEPGLSDDKSLSLFSFGLRGTGDIAYGFAERHDSLVPTAIKASQAIELIPFTAGAYRIAIQKKLPIAQVGRGSIVKVAEATFSGGRESRQIVLDNGEYLRFTQSIGCFVVHWSCALPFRTFAELVVKPTEFDDVPFRKGFVGFEREAIEDSYEATLALALDRADDVTYARFDTDKVAISWRGYVGTGDDGRLPLHECALVSTMIDHNLAASIIERAATAHIGRSAGLLNRFGDLEAGYPVQSARG